MKKYALLSVILLGFGMSNSALAMLWAFPTTKAESVACDAAISIFKTKFKNNSALLCQVRELPKGDYLYFATKVCNMNLNDMEPSGLSEGQCDQLKVQVEAGKEPRVTLTSELK